MSNHDDERASPARLGDEVLGPLLPVEFTDFVTTCSIPIIDSTLRPRLAMRGEGSLAKVHIASTHWEYNALSRGFGLKWSTSPLLTMSFNIPESECRDESSDNGDPCIIPAVVGLLVEALPSRTTDGLSLPTLVRGPNGDETILACGTY